LQLVQLTLQLRHLLLGILQLVGSIGKLLLGILQLLLGIGYLLLKRINILLQVVAANGKKHSAADGQDKRQTQAKNRQQPVKLTARGGGKSIRHKKSS
jgi:hypothetical protein